MMNSLAHQRSIQAWNRCINLAQECTTLNQLKAAQAVFITNGFHRNNYAISKLLTAFCSISSSGNGLHHASLVFNSIEEPNYFIYNTLIKAYSRSSQPHLALDYFRLMIKEDENLVVPDPHTFHFVILACLKPCLLVTGTQIHCFVVKNGVLSSDGHVQTGVIRMYAENKLLRDARKLFDEILERDVVKWNVLMSGYLRCDLGSDALKVFQEMFFNGIEPDEFCVTTALTACAQSGALMQGKWIHEYVKKKKGWESDVYIGTALVDMYAKCGCIDMASKVFEGMRKRNAFSWAAIIGGLAVHGCAKKAFLYLERMQVEDRLKPDGVVLLGVLVACTHAGLLEEGKYLLYNMKARYGITPKHEHYSCVVDLLCRAGQLDEALWLIRRMPMKPLASVWGALLSSCRIHKNIGLAELAVKELLTLEKGNGDEEDAALVQLSNVYFSAKRVDDAFRVRRVIGDRGLKKAPGCSVVEVDGKVNEFVSGDASHPNLAQIHAVLELLSLDPW